MSTENQRQWTQFGFIVPADQQDIVITGTKAWSVNQNPNFRVLTWPQMRRFVGIAFPKARQTVKATIVVDGSTVPNPSYLAALQYGQTSADQVTKFDTMAEQRKAEKAALKSLGEARKVLAEFERLTAAAK